MASLTHEDQRSRLVDAALALARSGVMSHTGHVNLSARIDAEHMLLTSRGTVAGVRADALAEALGAQAGTSAVLLANHGVLAFARSPLAAAKLVIVLEEAAAAELRAATLGGAKDLPHGAFDDVRHSMARTWT